MRKQVQSAVLEHLKKYGNLTAMEAFKKYHSMRLASIINRLRKDGYNITTCIETDKSTGSTYARYYYHGERGEANV